MRRALAAAALVAGLILGAADVAAANHDGDKHGKQLADCIDGDAFNTYQCM